LPINGGPAYKREYPKKNPIQRRQEEKQAPPAVVPSPLDDSINRRKKSNENYYYQGVNWAEDFHRVPLRRGFYHEAGRRYDSLSAERQFPVAISCIATLPTA
jgi:hypothetical protein